MVAKLCTATFPENFSDEGMAMVSEIGKFAKDPYPEFRKKLEAIKDKEHPVYRAIVNLTRTNALWTMNEQKIYEADYQEGFVQPIIEGIFKGQDIKFHM
jgi:hypothetical protein